MSLGQNIIDIARGKKKLKIVNSNLSESKKIISHEPLNDKLDDFNILNLSNLPMFKNVINSHSKERIKEFAQARKLYPKIVKLLQQKVKFNKKLKVCFIVIYDSCFQASNVFEQMLNDNMFEPFILVAPDIFRGKENMHYQMEKTYSTLNLKYSGYCYKSFDDKTASFIDYSKEMDLVCTANPYDEITHKFYTMRHLALNGVLSFFTAYAYLGRTNYEDSMINTSGYNFFWKLFAENFYSYKELFYHRLTSIENVEIIGYPKMDNLSLVKKEKRDRKKIIIAPHHTITEWKNGLNLGNFLEYADFFLELPKKYPQIDFIFRPHPLLVVNLRKNEIWSAEKTNKYLKAIEGIPNIEYQEGGDYFNTFVNSDGIIHDCGSFLAEYFYTDNPQCYILKNQEITKQEFKPFGEQMLNHTYKAFNKKDIIDFIEKVILQGEDYLKEKRIEFANKEIKINYPYSSKALIDSLKKEFITND